MSESAGFNKVTKYKGLCDECYQHSRLCSECDKCEDCCRTIEDCQWIIEEIMEEDR